MWNILCTHYYLLDSNFCGFRGYRWNTDSNVQRITIFNLLSICMQNMAKPRITHPRKDMFSSIHENQIGTHQHKWIHSELMLIHMYDIFFAIIYETTDTSFIKFVINEKLLQFSVLIQFWYSMNGPAYF